MNNNNQAPAPATQVRTPRPVTTIVLHKDIHLDEAGAVFCKNQPAAEVRFPGINKARTVFSQDCPDTAPEVWAARGQLGIGTGGDICDEHRNGGSSRISGECSMSLMVKEIWGNTLKDEALKRIVREILYFDENAGCPKGHLAEFTKVCHRCMPGADQILLNWSISAITAVYHRLSLNHAAGQGEKPFSVYAEEAFKAKASVYTDARAVKYVLNELRSVERMTEADKAAGRTEMVFSLDFVYKSFLRVDAAGASENILFIADKMYQDQVNFLAFLPEAQKSARKFTVRALLPGRGESDLTMMMLNTDHPQAAKALGQLGAQIRVIISDGQPVILINKRINGLSITTLRGMIRWLELPENKKSKVSFDSLVKVNGFHPDVPEWYANEFMIANGTKTHKAKRKTGVMDAAIREAVMSAFHPALIARWKGQRGLLPQPQKSSGGGQRRPEQKEQKPRVANVQPPKTEVVKSDSAQASIAPVVPTSTPAPAAKIEQDTDGIVVVCSGDKLDGKGRAKTFDALTSFIGEGGASEKAQPAESVGDEQPALVAVIA